MNKKPSACTAATASSSVLGASIGRDAAQDAVTDYVIVERRREMAGHCERREALVGCRVKWRYKGDVNWTRTNHLFGDRVRVKMTVEPVWID